MLTILNGNNVMRKSRINRIGKFLTDNVSVRGYSHIISGKVCQDNSISWHTDKYAGVIICDGHGGEKYIRSDKGSSFACKIGKKAIEEFMHSIKQLDKEKYKDQLTVLERHIINKWRIAAEQDISENPLMDDERFQALSDADKYLLNQKPIKAYGTTFIAAVLTSNYYFVIKLGDGNVNVVLSSGTINTADENNAEYDEGGNLKTVLEDDQLQFNVTTSLCQSNADTEFRHILVNIGKKRPVKGIVLTTDGIINCFKSVAAYKALIKNIYNAYLEIKNQNEIEAARAELVDGLKQLSEKGSGDDVSVAIAIR